MRRIIDQVQDQIQEVWDRGYRAKVTVEAIQRTAPGDDSEVEIPVALDASDCVGEKGATGLPDRNDDGMEGDGEWVRSRHRVNMGRCSAANVMRLDWLPQFQKQAGLCKHRYVGSTGKIVQNMGHKVVE